MIPLFKRIISSKLYEEVLKAQEAQLPVVFLGGKCDEKISWQDDIKNALGDKIFFLDPYDPHWKAEDNIYDEVAGLLVADYVVYYNPGGMSEKEQKVLDIFQKEYTEFDDLVALRKYLEGIARPSMKASKEGRMKKIAAVTAELDKIAEDLEKSGGERLALEVDRISDHLEKKALYNPMGWMPGRGVNVGLGKGYGMAWMPGKRLPNPQEQKQRAWFCPGCGRKIRQFGCGCFKPMCPLCKAHMQPC